MIRRRGPTRRPPVARALRFIAWTVFVLMLAISAWQARERLAAWIPLPGPLLSPAGTPSSTGISAESATGDAQAPSPNASPPPPHRQTAPLSTAQLGAPLVHGRFVSACGAPDAMKVDVKVKVRLGRAEAVDVKTTPADARIAACVAQAVRALSWDISPATGRVTAHY